MATLKVNVKMNEKMILLMTKAQKQAAIMTMEAMKRDIEKAEIVPRDVGTLEESVTANTGLINKGTVRLEYNTPYARRLYYHPEYDFSHDENANAQGAWLEPYIDGVKKSYARDTYKKIFKTMTGV